MCWVWGVGGLAGARWGGVSVEKGTNFGSAPAHIYVVLFIFSFILNTN